MAEHFVTWLGGFVVGAITMYVAIALRNHFDDEGLS